MQKRLTSSTSSSIQPQTKQDRPALRALLSHLVNFAQEKADKLQQLEIEVAGWPTILATMNAVLEALEA